MGEDSHRSERQLIRRRGRPKLGLAIYAFRRHRKVDGPLLRRGRSARRSAQRLSASSKGSLAGDDRLINKRRVLNAFRRHRRVYPRPALPSPPPATCAQRLSASWKGSRWSCLPLGPMRRRAQRRSASSKGSHLPSAAACQRQQVLNAFRQGFTGKPCDPINKPHVLNAFRRHRRVHSTMTGCQKPSGLCSTPFGVIEGFTTFSPVSRRLVICAQRRSASSKGSRP